MLNVLLSLFNCIVVCKFSSVHQITISYKSIKRGVSSMNQIFLPDLRGTNFFRRDCLLTSLSRQTIYFFKFYKWQIGECAGLIIFFCPVMILYPSPKVKQHPIILSNIFSRNKKITKISIKWTGFMMFLNK